MNYGNVDSKSRQEAVLRDLFLHILILYLIEPN